jgi:hypothetical protein
LVFSRAGGGQCADLRYEHVERGTGRVDGRSARGPAAGARRRRGWCRLERLLDRTSDIRISEPRHGPADARRYRYLPTYILRGLTRLYLEFDW